MPPRATVSSFFGVVEDVSRLISCVVSCFRCVYTSCRYASRYAEAVCYSDTIFAVIAVFIASLSFAAILAATGVSRALALPPRASWLES